MKSYKHARFLYIIIYNVFPFLYNSHLTSATLGFLPVIRLASKYHEFNKLELSETNTALKFDKEILIPCLAIHFPVSAPFSLWIPRSSSIVIS